jgi:hypothetical protein
MTEVRTISSGYLGLFATKDYDAGDVVLEEVCPLIRLSAAKPSNKRDDDNDDDNDKKMNSKESLMEKEISSATNIEPPEYASSDLRGTFKGMIQSGIVWIFQNESIEFTE